MKTVFWSAVGLAWLSLVVGGETCESGTRDLETACEYPGSLTLVSSPNLKQVDGNNCDAKFKKEDWQQQPKVIYTDAKPGKTYTLLNIDPDPPGYVKGQYYLHWLVTKIRGEDFAKGDLSKANHLTGYYGPAPPLGSGLHRYMFVVFEEKEANTEVTNPAARSKFEFLPWARNQEKLCGPVAGVQFRTETQPLSKAPN